MTKKSRDRLPEPLSADLHRLGQDLAAGNVSPGRLQSIMIVLGAMAPGAVTWADGSIANAAQLYPRHDERVSPHNLFQPSHRAHDILRREPKFAPLFIFHRDGYVREAALDQWTSPPQSAFFLAALALRLNDWVRPVRIAARRCAGRLLPATDAGVVVGAAPYLLDRSWRWARWDEEGMALVEAMYQRPDVSAPLADWLESAARGPLAYLLRFAARGPALDGRLPRLALSALQPGVRLMALVFLIEGHASWPVGHDIQWVDKSFGRSKRVTVFARRPIAQAPPIESLILAGLQDRSSRVRRMAADRLTQCFQAFPDLDEVLARLANDPDPSVRDRAAYIARRRSDGGGS